MTKIVGERDRNSYIYEPFCLNILTMRYFLLFTLLLAAELHATPTEKSPKDSLLQVLSGTTDPKLRISTFRNLADLTSETEESCAYLTQLVKEARVVGDVRPQMEALTELALNYMTFEKLDSARYYIDLAAQYAPKAERDRWCCLPEMRLFVSEMLSTEAQEALDEKINALKSRDISQESVYQQIRYEYIIGTALYNKGDKEEAIAYLDRAFKLAESLPLSDGAEYQVQILRQLSRVYNSMRNKTAAVEVTKSTLNVWQQHYNQFIKAKRPHYPADNFYATIYTSLMISADLLPPAEVKYYLSRLTEMSRTATNPSTKYNCFMTLANYNVHQNRFHEALRYNDSLIYYARRIATYNLPGVYHIKSKLHEYLGQSTEALASLRESYRLQDSIRDNAAQIEYNKLRMEYDVDKLNHEKAQLEIRNKHTMLMLLAVFLFFVLMLCGYLYISLRREKHLKAHIEKHKLRAEESEKLKSAFINSICHEIRTPLNGIVGFSELLLDPSLDEEERRTFPKEIQQNTHSLVSLIDSMLEVANLDVSNEQLPCTEIDLKELCHTVYDRFREKHPTSCIQGVLNLPSEVLHIQSNTRYLGLVLENLLANAYKFTTKGSITLDCHREAEQVVISITDTGCGIPVEQHKAVFDRFFKLNMYTPGSGLGLYLCKTIIRRLSGTIGFDPTYTGGTRVIVTLPLN